MSEIKKKTLLSWSSGKDSAWALYSLQKSLDFEVVGLFTTINQKYDRVAMHSTRVKLLKKQAEAVDLPIHIIQLPDPCSNEQYETIMKQFISDVVPKEIKCMAFGDLFLTDVRQYRENQLNATGIEPIFPLWGISTKELSEQMLSLGLETYISCVDLKKLPKDFAGRLWSKELITELPENCDVCGENGEFHTVVVNGPMFTKRIPVSIGEIVEKEFVAFADIIPINLEVYKNENFV